jgi:Protein of unknown function DUF58
VSLETGSRASQTSTSTVGRTRTSYTTRRTAPLVDAVVWWARAWRRVRMAAVAIARWLGRTVSPVGWTVAAVALVGLPLGLAFGWAEFLAAGGIAAVLLVLAVPFLFGATAYDVDLELADQRVVAGAEVAGGIRVVNTSGRLVLPGRVDIPVGAGVVEVHVPLLRPGAEHAAAVSVPARRRGIVRVGPVTSVRGDPLGILHREVTWTRISELFVHPVTTALAGSGAGLVRDLEGEPTATLVDSDISFHAIREYQPGDAQRQIHWKSTAKTGSLMVRQFEETRRSRLAVLLSLDPEDYADADEFELAVSAVGSIGVRALRDGRDLTLITSDEIPELVRTSMRSIKTLPAVSPRILLDGLAAIEQSIRTMEIEEVCRLAGRAMGDVSIAFVVCGSTLTASRLQAAALGLPLDTTVVALLCDPESEPGLRSLADLRVLSIGVLDDLRHVLAAGR